MINYLNWDVFEDTMERFKWYPKPFRLIIFCRDNVTMEMFLEQIKTITSLKVVNRTTHFISCFNCFNDRQSILIFKHNDGKYACGMRANVVFYDVKYPLQDIQEIITPLATAFPSQGAYAFDSFSLKRMFEYKGNGAAYRYGQEKINENKEFD